MVMQLKLKIDVLVSRQGNKRLDVQRKACVSF